MTILAILLLFTCSVTGAVLYRMRGGAPSWPRPIEQMLFCSIFAFAMGQLGVNIWVIALAYGASVGFCLSGHGQYFLAMVIKPIEPERFDRVIAYFYGQDPRTNSFYECMRNGDVLINHPKYDEAVQEIQDVIAQEYGHTKLFWRCASGLALTGGLVSVAPGMAMMYQNFWAGLAVAASGFVAKPTAYLISHYAGEGTEGGEYGYGAIQWAIVALVLIVLFGVML